MRGASREAAAAGREALTSALAVADAASLAGRFRDWVTAGMVWVLVVMNMASVSL